MMPLRHAVAWFFVLVVVAGCASTETVKEAQGQDVSRSYPYAYDRVFDAVVDIELQGGK